MGMKKSAIAVSVVLALAAGAAQAAATGGTIAVTFNLNGETSTSDMTEDQLRGLLAESGFDERTINKAVKTGLSEGKLLIKGEAANVADSGAKQPKLGK